jgi:hypothetical protein
MSQVTTTAHWPFDGSNVNPQVSPLLVHSPTLTGSDISAGSIFLPMTPSQAFEIARNIKSMFLQAQLVVFEYEIAGVPIITDSEQISFANLVKRYTIPPNATAASTSPAYTVCRTKFQAQSSGTGVVNFGIDFSAGYYGIARVTSSIKKYMWSPKLTLSMAGSHGTLKAASAIIAGTSGLFQWNGFQDNSIVSVPFNAVGTTIGITINSALISGASGIRATERFDTIHFSTPVARAGDTISIMVPAIDPVNYNTTLHRSGFADVTQVWFTGAKVPITRTLGSPVSATNFVLGATTAPVTASTVLDIIMVKVPATAKTGPISFVSVANPASPVNTTDYFSSLAQLTVID